MSRAKRRIALYSKLHQTMYDHGAVRILYWLVGLQDWFYFYFTIFIYFIFRRNHFNKLYHGTSQVIKDLCDAGEYQTEFLTHSPCLDKVRQSYESCAQQYQKTIDTMTLISQENSEGDTNRDNRTSSTEAENVRSICCSFRQYLDCSEHAAQRICGERTGKFIRGFLDRMSHSLIKMYCNEYQLGTEKCYGYSSAATSSLLLPTMGTVSLTFRIIFTLLIFFRWVLIKQ